MYASAALPGHDNRAAALPGASHRQQEPASHMLQRPAASCTHHLDVKAGRLRSVLGKEGEGRPELCLERSLRQLTNCSCMTATQKEPFLLCRSTPFTFIEQAIGRTWFRPN